MKIIYKNWALRFLIWVLIINCIIAYFVATGVIWVNGALEHETRILYLGYLATFLLVLAIIFTAISLYKKEPKDYKFWFSVILISFFVGVPLILEFM